MFQGKTHKIPIQLINIQELSVKFVYEIISKKKLDEKERLVVIVQQQRIEHNESGKRVRAIYTPLNPNFI